MEIKLAPGELVNTNEDMILALAGQFLMNLKNFQGTQRDSNP